MTEDEAKAKWCPFGRVANQSGSFNRSSLKPELDGVSLCIGSACMAWRVLVMEAHQENVFNTKTPPEGDGWKPQNPSPHCTAWFRTIPEKRIGYCGLAGQPQ